jgi:hypothetical protein
MAERLKAEKELKGTDESRRDAPGGQKEREGKEFSRERRPEEAGRVEALTGDKSGGFHGFGVERGQARCHPRRDRRFGSNSLRRLDFVRMRPCTAMPSET